MDIHYKINQAITTEQFVNLLKESTLGERRPIENTDCMSGMIQNSNLMITAWHYENLIGIARSMTDFHYACYLSDLAVDQKHQNSGIGKQLLKLTKQQLGQECKLILISAPAANSYYRHLGLTLIDRCWLAEPESAAFE